MPSAFRSWSVLVAVLLGVACAEQPAATSPQAAAVQIATVDPPAGAEDLGPIQVKDSEDCDIVSPKGTREGAMARLKEAAVGRGIDYVRLLKVREPYSDHECYHKAYVLQGIGYRTKHAAPAPAASAAPGGALPVEPATPPALPVAEASCEPPCAAGYVCQAGVCAAACEPACVAPQVCRADRVCVTPTP